jgi:hypothetical protein
MRLVHILNGGRYPGTHISVLGEPYEVRQEGSRWIVDVPEVAGPHLKAHGFEPEAVAHDAMIDRAAKEAMARRAEDEKKAKIERLARAGMLPYTDENGNLMNPEYADAIDQQLKVQEENQQLKRRLMNLEQKLDMLVGSDKPQEQKAEPFSKDKEEKLQPKK